MIHNIKLFTVHFDMLLIHVIFVLQKKSVKLNKCVSMPVAYRKFLYLEALLRSNEVCFDKFKFPATAILRKIKTKTKTFCFDGKNLKKKQNFGGKMPRSRSSSRPASRPSSRPASMLSTGSQI